MMNAALTTKFRTIGAAVALAALLAVQPALAAGVSCTDWNTRTFFKKARVVDVSRCLKADADPKARNDKGRTPLHFAANSNKNTEVITALLKAGADLEAQDDTRTTPLHIATLVGNMAAVIPLLKAGADPNARNEFGDTPVHEAALNESPAAVMALLKAGADPNARNRSGSTPLHTAVEYTPSPDVISALVAGGADPNVRTYQGGTPLQDAREKNPALMAAFEEEAVVAFMLKHKQPEVTGLKKQVKNQVPASRLSCDGWNTSRFYRLATVEEVSHCLKAGADPNARNAEGETPLHVLADSAITLGSGGESKYQAFVEALVAAGADPNARNGEGGTPLYEVVSTFGLDLDFLTALLKAGADPNAREPVKKHVFGDIVIRTGGNTPLHRAVAMADEPVVITALLAGGADPNARNAEGKTPLQEAAEASDSQARMAAFKEEAVAAYRNKQRQAEAAALKRQVEKQVRASRVSCEAWNTSKFFMYATLADLSSCLKTKDPNARDKEGRTSLHLAAVFGKSPAIVAALVQAGADPTALDEKGRTPLQYAEKFSKMPKIVSVLRKVKDTPSAPAEAVSQVSCDKWNTAAFFKHSRLADLLRCLKTKDPNARNENGRTPLHYAAQGGTPSFVVALATAGAHVNARDKRGGWTPLHLAAWFGKSRAVFQALLDVGADPDAKDDAGRTPLEFVKENPALN